MKMPHERLVILKTGRMVKLIASEATNTEQATYSLGWDILVKEPKESQFRPLIEANHPIYWKLKRFTPLQRKLVELEYSGISKVEIKKILIELGQIIGGQVPKSEQRKSGLL